MQRQIQRHFSGSRSVLKVLSGSKSPLHLVQGVYNPPKSMSKSSAKRWAKVAPLKSAVAEKKDIKELVIERSFPLKEQDEGKTLEQVTSSYFGLDPPSARLKILAGEVWLKGSMHAKYADNSKPKQVVHYGDTLAGFIKKPATKEEIARKVSTAQLDLKDQVIYKDKDIVILNKPQNIATHAGSKHGSVNIESLLDESFNGFLRGKNNHGVHQENYEKLRLVHRLDKGTTGCLVLARNKEAAARLTNLFKDPEAMTKKYLAMTIPPLPKINYAIGKSFTYTTGLVDHGENRNLKKKVVDWNDTFQGDEFGKIQKATTKITVLHTSKLSSLLCLEPKTGRKHQLRAHIASLDSFIVGDYKYGIGCTKKFAHQVSDPLKVPLHLHFWRLIIPNWFGEGKDLDVVAPLPNMWTKSLASSGHFLDVAQKILL